MMFKNLPSRLQAWQRRDALDRLIPFGQRGTIIVTIVLLALFYAAVGYFSHYWRDSDMDFMVLYSAFLMNDGKAQAYFDHPGYLTIVSMQPWLLLLHKLGVLKAYALSMIPVPSDPAFDVAMNAAVRALRAQVWLIGMAIALVFYALMRRLVTDWRVASLAFTAFIFSGGVAVHLHMARTEMIAATFVVIALLILMIAARHASAWRPVSIGVAASLCVLAMENKVQALFLIAALPVLAIAFGERAQFSKSWKLDTNKKLTLAGLAALLGILVWQAWPLIEIGLKPAAMMQAGLTPLLPGHVGLYQAAFIGWIFAGVLAYAWIWRVSATETAATLLCIGIGALLALLVLNLQSNASNVVAVFNPVERMLTFLPVTSGGESGSLFAKAVSGLRLAFIQYAFFINPVPRPTVFLLWLVVPGIAYAAWRARTKLAIQTALLVATGIAMDAVGAQRQIKLEYWVFSDPFFIIAGALLLDGLPALRQGRWAYPAGLVLLTANIVIGLSEPLKHMLQVQGPRTVCTLEKEYTPDLKLPWCTTPPLRNPLDNVPSIWSQTFGRSK